MNESENRAVATPLVLLPGGREPGTSAAALAVANARREQPAWARRPLAERLAVVRGLRHRLAGEARRLAATVERRPLGETLAAEVMPLAEACRFLEKRAARWLAPRRPRSGRLPLWLRGVDLEIRRDPFGVVLVIGPANYPLLLAGVQLVQALAAGNAVVVKPGHGGHAPLRLLVELLVEAGLPEALAPVLDEPAEGARQAIDAGVDKVILTGSAETGRAVLARLAPRLVPAAMELSGCDAVFVRRDADLDLATRALRFGLDWNGGQTCIAPRRVFVERTLAGELEKRLRRTLEGVEPRPIADGAARALDEAVTEALTAGARLICGRRPEDGRAWPLVLGDVRPGMSVFTADLQGPILSLVPVTGDEEALALDARCPYSLGATVFGEPTGARRLARRIDAGVVVINDLIVPTADPRAPFGGRGSSGFGSTRGGEGLLELTRPKAVLTRRGRSRRHLEPLAPGDEEILAGYLAASHAPGFGARLRALGRLATAALRRRR